MDTWGEGIMANILKLIHTQNFVNTDIIEVNHNSGYEYLKVKVIVDGESSESLIKSIITNKNNPTNVLTVTLMSSQTGVVQLFGSDVTGVGENSATELHTISEAVREVINEEVTTISGMLQDKIDDKDNYQSWSFAVNGLTQDEITSRDVLNFVGAGAVTVARSDEDEITISGSSTTNAVKAMMVYNTVVQTNVDTAESLRLAGITRLDSCFSIDGTNSTEITISESGWYEFQYSVAFDSDYRNRVIMRVYVERNGSGSWVGIDQSYSYEYLRYNTYGRMSNNTASFFLNASVGEKFRVRMDGATTGSFPSTLVNSNTIQNQCWVTVKSIDFDGIKGSDGADGVDGAQGPQGSGSTINVQDNGSSVSGSPFQILNFKNFDYVSSVVSGTVDITVPVFGSEYHYASVDSTTNTNRTYPLNKLTMTTSSLPVGNYRIGWYYEWRRNTTSNDFRARVQIDNSITVMEHSEEPKDVNSWHTVMEHSEESKDVNSWHVESGFVHKYIPTVANHTIDIDYWGESYGGTSYIRRVRIELWRVS